MFKKLAEVTFKLGVTNSKSKNKKQPLELLTRSQKIKNFPSSYKLEVEKYKISLRVTNSMVKLLFFRFRVTNSRLKNKKLHFELLTRNSCTFIFLLSSYEHEVDKGKTFLKYYICNIRELLGIDTTHLISKNLL